MSRIEDYDFRLDFNFNTQRIDSKTRMRVIFWLLSHPNKDETPVLVCGCGVGVTCKALREKGINVVGLDINRIAVKVASSNIPGVHFVVGDATKLPFRNEVFSKTICSAVLEHISNDRRAIFEIQRTLKGGQELAITVPRRRHLKSDTGLLKKVERRFGHVREGYTLNDISSLIEGEKMKVVKVKFYWGPLHWFMLKLFEVLPNTTKNTLGFTEQETKSFRGRLRSQAWKILIRLLNAVAQIDESIPFPRSTRFGLGILLKKE